MKSNGRGRKVKGKTPRYGRQRERRWTPTRAVAQDTRASPNSLETHLVRKRGDIGHLRALIPWINGWMDGWMECQRERGGPGPGVSETEIEREGEIQRDRE